MRAIIVLTVLCSCALPCRAQFSVSQLVGATGVPKAASDGIKTVNGRALSFLQNKYGKMDASVEKQSRRMLARMQKKEETLKRKLYRRDSAKAAQLFAGADERYAGLKNTLSKPFDSSKAFPLKEYIPGVDSVQTALNFLKREGVDLPADKMAAIGKAGTELKALQDRLQKANDIESYVKGRERELKAQLQNSGLARQLKGINKEAFYYGQRLRDYKEALKNPEKMEEKVLAAVRDSKAFRSFMQKHSYLAKLFPAPDNYGTPAALAGLQTRAGVQQALQQRFGSSVTSPVPGGGSALSTGNTGSSTSTMISSSYVQQQIGAAQTQLASLKDKVNKLGIRSGNSGDMTMPDFKPNGQHTKSFLQRIEYGANVQSEGARHVLPATSEMALTAGYKLSDKSVIGIGASYRVGWGHEGFKHITVTNEGVGLRSYVDIKAKGSFWLSGGYEMNYQQSFAHYQQLYHLDMWQRSGLIGITKKYKVGKRENNVQVLWDFLSYQQVPRTQAIKFRVGFGL